MRSRLLRPDFFVHEKLCERPPLERLLFEGLWCLADREGRLEDRPGRIKVQVLPWEACDVDEMLDGLAGIGSIVRYEANGRRYISIPSFLDHQSPHHREPKSEIPAPSAKKPGLLKARPGKSKAKPSEAVGASRVFPTETVTGSAVSPVTGDGSSPPPAKRQKTQRQLDVERVHAVWRVELGQPDLPPGKEWFSIVGARLADGAGIEQLCLVPMGAKVDVARWPPRAAQLGPEYLFGSMSLVSKFVGLSKQSQAVAPPAPPTAHDLLVAAQMRWDQAEERHRLGGTPMPAGPRPTSPTQVQPKEEQHAG